MPGRVRSGWTLIRPARSCSAPECFAQPRRRAAGPPPRRSRARSPPRSALIVPSGPVTSSPSASTVGDDRAHVQLDAHPGQRLRRLGRELGPERRQRHGRRRRRAAPVASLGVDAGGTGRRSVSVASSRICPASSTPVGPAPTEREGQPTAALRAGRSRSAAISNAPKTGGGSSGRRPGSSSRVRTAANSSCPK